MLEASWVSRVTGDGNIYAFFPHDGNAFANVVCSIAVNFSTRSVAISNAAYFFEFSAVVVKFCLHIGKSVDTANDLRSVFTQTVQEILTVKSDDIDGRRRAYEAIIKGQNIPTPGVPESFKVLVKELQALALDVRVLDKDGEEIQLSTLCNAEEESPYSKAPEIDFSEEFKDVETDDLGDSFIIENADDEDDTFFGTESDFEDDGSDLDFDDENM